MTEHDSSFIVGMGAGIIEYNRDSGEWVELVALESDPLVRMNDGRTAPAGRLWIGSMDERADDEPDFPGGHLFRVERDGSVAAVMDRVGTSNGLAFAPDGSVMYWTDTWQQVVWAFDYDVDTGSAHNQRPLIDFSPLPGKPDGACMDADGCYWVACVYGWSVVRITPTGKLDRRVELPVHKPSMPAFAGPNLETMVVTSISSGGRHPAEEGSVPAGSLVAFEPGTRGLPEPVCRVRV
jgi:sugar lactone lactonase YvrE